MRPFALALAVMLAPAVGCTTGAAEIPSWRGPSLAHQQRLIADAEAFMADYARLLLAGDRAAISALYGPDGAILIRDGRRLALSRAEIVERYREPSWQPPAGFLWRDLHYEAVGPDAVVVLGIFQWDEGGTGYYHALLRREAGRLLIRIEDETVDPIAH